jgi:16S rRNA (cytosine967-C5)-methyltransferase
VARLVVEVSERGDADERAQLPRADGRAVLLARPLFPDPSRDLAGNLAERFAVPRPAVARWLAQRGEAATRQILAASISRPATAVRPAAGRVEEVEVAFARARIAPDREGPCLLVRGVGGVSELPLFAEGAFSVQDPTAAEVVPFAAPPPGERVLDLCAAPGGKSFALAESVGPAGSVVAVDASEERLAPMRAEVARRGVRNVEVLRADATRAEDLPPGPFALVLVDAPCSNSGVLSRRVEARRRLGDAAALASLTALQDALLAAAATRVAPGGRLVLSTCSIDDEEDAARVRAFLARTPGFRLDAERLTLPVSGRRDGGYVARLVRG